MNVIFFFNLSIISTIKCCVNESIIYRRKVVELKRIENRRRAYDAKVSLLCNYRGTEHQRNDDKLRKSECLERTDKKNEKDRLAWPATLKLLPRGVRRRLRSSLSLSRVWFRSFTQTSLTCQTDLDTIQ